MTLHPIPLNFLSYEENFNFFFISVLIPSLWEDPFPPPLADIKPEQRRYKGFRSCSSVTFIMRTLPGGNCVETTEWPVCPKPKF
jgi:hypothetical protein